MDPAADQAQQQVQMNAHQLRWTPHRGEAQTVKFLADLLVLLGPPG